MKGLLFAVCACVMVSSGVGRTEPRKVLVLPLDGSVDPAMRSKLNASLEKAARGLGGTITVGDTTFDETATAIGCAPAEATCAEHVRTTLGYDVLVWGTVSTSGDQAVLVVKRTSAGSPPRTDRIELVASASPEHADDKLRDVFGGARPTPAPARPPPPAPRPTPPPTPTAPPPATPEPVLTGDPAQPAPTYDTSMRTRGITFAAVGGGMLVAGIAVWATKASTQDDIDSAPIETADDFRRLEALEGRARNLALLGDILVVGGVALGGYGAWVLYQDREQRRVVVAPTVTPTAAAVTIGGHW